MNAVDKMQPGAAEANGRIARTACDARPMVGCRSRCRTARAAGSGTPTGKKYLDGLGGIAVNTLGHAHPRTGAGAAGADRPADPFVELLPRAAAGAAGRQAVRAVGPRQRLLLQHRARSERGGDQGRAQVRPRPRHRPARDHRLREGLPRPLDRHPVGHRQRQGAGRLRPAGRRLRAGAAERHRGDRGGGQHAARTWSRSSSR